MIILPEITVAFDTTLKLFIKDTNGTALTFLITEVSVSIIEVGIV